MEDIAIKAMNWSKKRKKISYDIDVDTLGMIDEFAEVTKLTRSEILDSVIYPGVRAQVETMLGMWKALIKDEKYREKQERIKELIKGVESYKKKWKFDEFPALVERYVPKTKKK